MILSDIKIYQYDLLLNKPIIVRGQGLSCRQGFLLEFKSDNGLIGWGEASPLPSFTPENLAQIKSQLIKSCRALKGTALPEDLYKLNGQCQRWLAKFELSATARFGLETAALNLTAAHEKMALNELIVEEPHSSIAVTALLQGRKEEVLQQVQIFFEQGFRSFKLKVDRDVDAAVAKVIALQSVLQGQALLKLDANQSWSMSTAIKFAEEAGLASVEYIEEPFKDIELIPDFVMKTTIPVALDESLSNLDIKRVRSLNGVDILVIKPALLGGLESAWQWMLGANAAGIETIISSTFESSVGIRALALLASCQRFDLPAGLDTLKWFKDDTMQDKIEISRGRIDLHQPAFRRTHINRDCLREITYD